MDYIINMIVAYNVVNIHGAAQFLHEIYKTFSYDQALLKANEFIEKVYANAYTHWGKIKTEDGLVEYTIPINEERIDRVVVEYFIINDFLDNIPEQEIREFISLAVKNDPITLDMIRDILKI